MHLITAKQFKSKEQINKLFNIVDSIKEGKNKNNIAKNKILATIFYEPSTRTRLSFESAMLRLGGKIISGDSNSMSHIKGESLRDTVETIDNYADIIVLRHSNQWAAEQAVKVASHATLINAGNGTDEHPTQALLDLYTIQKYNNNDEITICFCGDLENGRPIHSLIPLLKLWYKKVNIYTVSDPRLSLPAKLAQMEGISVKVYNSIYSIPHEEIDICYMTRLQKERINYLHGKIDWSNYSLTIDTVKKFKESVKILHPLPRNDEIPPEIDVDPRSVYLKEQVQNGLLVRMGLLYSTLKGIMIWDKYKEEK